MNVTTETSETEEGAKGDEVRNPSPTKQRCQPSPKRKKRETPFLRKAPQAPKRFRSSYICFFTAKQPEIKKELGDISRRSAYMWKMLSPEDRRFWDNVAAKDKQRYLAEKASYSGPWHIPYKRPKKDPSAPKRPMSAFLHFTKGRRSRIKNENPGMKNTEVSKVLGNLWRESTDEERKPYIEKEKVERGKYKIAMSKWKESFDKRQKEESEQLQQRYYQQPSQPHRYQPPPYHRHQQQQQHQHRNDYARNDADANYLQQTTQNYPYSDFQPPVTSRGPPRHVSNPTEISYDFINETNCDSIGDDSVIIDHYVPRDDQLPQNNQMSQQ
eukprot:CAMPEP_0116124394 /NCGR_PEP_ID=MMETSP0329-20121206/5258_1 /TAXON_ID=697910 /ORGANISM="Pseudo-nitzschia arenysensis, Strain B593" /LENGTH=326 /DNA_ID=CAMNT_0003618373 /DNA_START=196 /DNA_END=1173 /DNA_ORIENTATION=-